MKILLQSYWFWPRIGGLESVSHLLAEGFANAGHRVTVVTSTPASAERTVSYNVVRCPNLGLSAKLVSENDIVYSNGSSTHFFPFALLYGKPFVWTHADQSMQWKTDASRVVVRSGDQSKLIAKTAVALYRLAQVSGRRLVAHFASANIAVSRYMAAKQPLCRQHVIYNPFDFDMFRVENFQEAEQALCKSQFTFSFLGRLTKEKGVDDLLFALASVNHKRRQRNQAPATLQVIGDGDDRAYLFNLAEKLGVANQVEWRGFQTGPQLKSSVDSAGIFVLPSRYEEPMGIAALELMAAGKPLIVSMRGGLSECCGDACLTFPNGDPEQLGEAMDRLSLDVDLQKSLISNGLKRIELFDPGLAIRTYLDLFASLVNKSS